MAIGRDDMSYAAKMDVLDLIIETLKEHERALDDLAHRLESCLNGAPTARAAGVDGPSEGSLLDSWR